jgi:hypothetical protein
LQRRAFLTVRRAPPFFLAHACTTFLALGVADTAYAPPPRAMKIAPVATTLA